MAKKQSVIEVNDFSLAFGKKQVIKNLSFSVKKGEVFGFLGSNGSGKTTTIRTLLGIYEQSNGHLHINGEKFSVDKHGSIIGYLPEERGIYKKERVLDVMVFFGQLKGMAKDDAKQWSLNYLKRVKLDNVARTRIDKLSGGMQQKVQLGITIMNDPELLILDEPTKGFDPINRRLLTDIITERQRAGATIVYISHHMEEVEKLCDRILLLKDGRAEAYGTITQVKKQFNGASLDDIFVKVYKENEG